MEKDTIIMSKKQLNRFDVLSKANAGYITVQEASETLGLSERQVKRLKKKVREEGATGLIHGNTGKLPANRMPDETRAQILEARARPEYAKCNFAHFTELLFSEHGIEASYTTVYRMLKADGIKTPKTRRRFKPHRRRKRRLQAGLLLQVDATPFAWFSGDHSHYALHGGIDDATGQITGLFITKNECLHGYFEMLRRTIDNFGIPASVYADRHTIFQSPNAKKHEIDASFPLNDTQFGRCLKELGVTLIAARSPQAKGRVERLWGTLQSRLPVEFAIRKITTMEAANEFLARYVFDFNVNFAVDPENTQNAFRKPHKTDCIDHILCVKEVRVVDAGGVFSYGGKSFKVIDSADAKPIPTKSKIRVLVGARIGIMAEWKGGIYDVLPFVPPKRVRNQAKANPEPRVTPPPPLDHAWRVDLCTHIHTFDKYEADDAYRETIRLLEQTLLGKRR